MQQRIKDIKTWIPLSLAVVFIIGLLCGGASSSPAPVARDQHSKLSTILQYIEDQYVDDIDTDSLLETMFPGLLTSLDPHSVYIPAKDLQAVNEDLEGSFSGIGISFNMLTDTITVVEVISGGPSESVGLMPGDRIMEINDTVVAGKGWSNEKVITHLRGPEGTKVKLGIKRGNSDEIHPFEITRGPIPVTSIDACYMLDDKTGYVKVNKFGRETYEEFLKSTIELKASGAEKFVIDLRGNGGGYMEMAIMMANEFLPSGSPIVSTKGRAGYKDQAPMADGTGRYQSEEVAVLMDEFSASASEIFAGAIQDNDRGLVVGRRSFGKGLVQQQIMLPDSSAIRLTIARYYTPSGRSIQKKYEHGGTKAYQEDLIERYDRGELFSADSIKLDKSITFHTMTGRPVYGGGGIMPDIFVANDTTGYTKYYGKLVNGGVLQKFSFHYNDKHRAELSKASTPAQLTALLPQGNQLLDELVAFAEKEGIATERDQLNKSATLLVNQLKALIARNALGVSAYYQVDNLTDPSVIRALEALRSGKARFPIMP